MYNQNELSKSMQISSVLLINGKWIKKDYKIERNFERYLNDRGLDILIAFFMQKNA